MGADNYTALITADDGRWTYAGAFCGALFVVSNVVTLAPWIRCRPRKRTESPTPESPAQTNGQGAAESKV